MAPEGDPAAPVVVIADDDPDIRHLVGVAARRAGASVGATVSDGAAALHAIRAIRPDLVILDVAMPELSGLEVCRSLRSDPGMSRTRIMLLSAAVHQEAIDAGSAAGADLYVQKPFSPRSLAGQIAGLLAAERVR